MERAVVQLDGRNGGNRRGMRGGRGWRTTFERIGGSERVEGGIGMQ